MVRVFPSCIRFVTNRFHFGVRIVQNFRSNQCKHETEVRVSFGIDSCPILYRCLINLGPSLELNWVTFWSFGVSATNLDPTFRMPKLLKLRFETLSPFKALQRRKRWPPHRMRRFEQQSTFNINCI